MPESEQTPAQARIAIARAARRVKNHPGPDADAALEAARRDYTAALIRAYISRVLAAGPLPSESQLLRLAALLVSHSEARP